MGVKDGHSSSRADYMHSPGGSKGRQGGKSSPAFPSDKQKVLSAWARGSLPHLILPETPSRSISLS